MRLGAGRPPRGGATAQEVSGPIASSQGSATAAPIPRSRVRREMLRGMDDVPFLDAGGKAPAGPGSRRAERNERGESDVYADIVPRRGGGGKKNRKLGQTVCEPERQSQS